MRFKISRTGYCDMQPCEESYSMLLPYWHTRTMPENEFNDKFSKNEGLWKDNGINHKTVRDGKWISRQENDATCWVIEIESLNDLISLSNKYGELSLSCDNMPEIVIRDDIKS